MLEALLNSNYVPQLPDLPGVFLFDPATQKDLIADNATVVLRANPVVDNTNTIDGHPTLRMPTTTAGITITLPTPIDLDVGDWTIEWSSQVDTFAAQSYDHELIGRTTNSKALGCRWTDGGYSYLLQFSTGLWTNEALFWRISPAKVDLGNGISRYAMVCQNGVVTIYRNGVAKKVTNYNVVGNASKQVTRDNFPKEAVLGKLKTLILGWESASSPSPLASYGRIRISDYARYAGGYTPRAF